MKFQPGDKAIHIGGGQVPPETDVEVVTVGPWEAGDRVQHGGVGRIMACPADYKVRDAIGEFFCLENKLRKPDDYDITAQEWYQRILRGEQVEEPA